jgi:hypothetical protein
MHANLHNYKSTVFDRFHTAVQFVVQPTIRTQVVCYCRTPPPIHTLNYNRLLLAFII